LPASIDFVPIFSVFFSVRYHGHPVECSPNSTL